jgi:predicted ATPase/DNA-binding SARP family transcriptional activator
VELRGVDGGTLSLRSPRQRALLAVLAARAGRSVAVDELVQALWGDEWPRHPAAALQSQVHRLRLALDHAGLTLETTNEGYRLAGPAGVLDSARFESLVEQVGCGGQAPEVGASLLFEALALWRGRAYSDVDDIDVVRVEARRLEELRAGALETRARLLLAAGRPADAAAAADAALAEHPYREGLVAACMEALARQGRHVDALRAFERFRRLLADELGLEPSADLRATEQAILAAERPPGPAVLGLPGNSFVGREKELNALDHVLGGARLVTLTGPGGVGKTRLARHLAARTAARFPDGVHLCELAPVSDPGALAGTVAATLRLEIAAGSSFLQRIVDFLHTRRVLLVLDNCEHVAEAASALVAALLTRTTDVTILATSRRRLGVEGEHVHVVTPLPTSTEEGVRAAADLFVDRAVAAGAHPPTTAGDADAVRELCRRLDGLPLAIELAAARSVTKAPDELVAEVSGHLDRLADAQRTVGRHRSIDATVSWSYDLLDEDLQRSFRALAVFAGSVNPDGLAAVLGWPPGATDAALAGLVDHSLLAAAPSPGGMRFTVLEPVRQFALGRLVQAGEHDTTQAAHAAWAARWMERADRELRGPDEVRWAAATDAELANLRAAHRWSLDHDHALATRLVAALFWYAYFHGPAELFAWADETVTRCSGRSLPGLPGAYATVALGWWRRGDLSRARTAAETGIELAERHDAVAARFAWEALRSTEALAGDYDRALRCRERTLLLAVAAGDPVHEAHARTAGALALGYIGRLEEAKADIDRATGLLRGHPNPTELAFADYVAGEIQLEVAPPAALALLERARDRALEAGNRFIASIAGASAASCAARAGDPERALTGFGSVIETFHRSAAWPQLWTTVRSLVEALVQLDRYEQAAVLLGALEGSGARPVVRGADLPRLARTREALVGVLGPEPMAVLLAQGAALDDDQAVQRALEATRPVAASGAPQAG